MKIQLQCTQTHHTVSEDFGDCTNDFCLECKYDGSVHKHTTLLAGTLVLVQMPSVWSGNMTCSVHKHTIPLARTLAMAQTPSVWIGNTTAVYINTPYTVSENFGNGTNAFCLDQKYDCIVHKQTPMGVMGHLHMTPIHSLDINNPEASPPPHHTHTIIKWGP